MNDPTPPGAPVPGIRPRTTGRIRVSAINRARLLVQVVIAEDGRQDAPAQRCLNSLPVIHVPSDSTPGRLYKVRLLPAAEGWPTCTCPAGQYRGPCKHIPRALDARCEWNSWRRNATKQKTVGICPDCDGSTEPVSPG